MAVLCGRGGHATCHPGNLRFRQLMSVYRSRYLGANRNGKSRVAMDALQEWRSQDPPGRFLKKSNMGDDNWNDVGDTEARRKVAQTLREKELNPSMDPSYLPSGLATTSVASPPMSEMTAVPPNQYDITTHHPVNGSQENPLQFYGLTHHAALTSYQQLQLSQAVPTQPPLSLLAQVLAQNSLSSTMIETLLPSMIAPHLSSTIVASLLSSMVAPPSTSSTGAMLHLQQQQQQQQTPMVAAASYVQAAPTIVPSFSAHFDETQHLPATMETVSIEDQYQQPQPEEATIVSLSSFSSGSKKRSRQDTTIVPESSTGVAQELNDFENVLLLVRCQNKKRRHRKSSSSKDQRAKKSRRKKQKRSPSLSEGLSAAVTQDMFSEEYFQLNLNMADCVVPSSSRGQTDEAMTNLSGDSLFPGDDME